MKSKLMGFATSHIIPVQTIGEVEYQGMDGSPAQVGHGGPPVFPPQPTIPSCWKNSKWGWRAALPRDRSSGITANSKSAGAPSRSKGSRPRVRRRVPVGNRYRCDTNILLNHDCQGDKS